MHDRTIEENLPGRTLSDPEGFERYVPPNQADPVPSGAVGSVIWEYTYSRFGRAHGPLTIKADSLPEAKDQIRRRHQLPDYRSIRIRRAA